MDVMGEDIFVNCQFVLDLGSAPYKKKSYIKKLISSNGGQISYILTPRSDFLIVPDSPRCKHLDTCQSRKAIRQGIPIVSEKYVEKCIAKGKLLDKDEFIVTGETALKKFSKGKIATPNKPERKEFPKHFRVENLNCYKLESGDCEDFGENFQVVKFAILVENHKTGKGHLVSKCVEIHTRYLSSKNALRVVLYTKGQEVQSESRGLVYQVQNSWDAVQCFKALVEKMQQKGMKRVFSLLSGDKVGSPNLRRLLDEMKNSAGQLHPEVVRLVETAWKDSLGELESILSVTPQNVTIDQVRNAAIVLIKIQDALKNDRSVSKYSDEFYKYLPHKENRPIDSLAVVAKKQELCQLLKDVMLAGETAWLSKYSNSALSQYMALNCSLLWVDPQEKDYKLVKDMMSMTEMKITVRNIFHVSRSIENADFREDLPNIKFLFHGSSPANYVGIFTRGLLLPDVVTGQFGGTRSDEGNFGSGIYFSNSLSTSLKYAVPSPNRGSRLVLLNKVALGKVFETHEKMPGITAPPLGYDSIKGVLSNSMNKLEASDSEFIVYSANQQKMAYLVELTIDDEEVFHHPCTELKIDVQEHQADENVSEVDLNPSIKVVESGLIAKGKPYSAKLEEVHVRAKVIDMVAEVVIFQAYSNKSPEELEAKYVFPLSEDAAVCGFEAFINNKHVVGIVKEKEQAHREYKQAVSEGHGAYLMDQEEPSIFTVSVGNIPPFARVVIKLTYVTELKIAGGCEGCILFSLPGNVSPWKEVSTQLSSSMTQATTESVVVSNMGKSSLLISVDMPFNIIDLTSPTHKIVTKRTLSKACVRLSEGCCLGQDFTLLVKVAEVHVPRMWVERNEDEDENQASMVTFFPEFDIEEVKDFDCFFILDMSNSMHGNPCNQAKALVAPLIDDLPEECSFNVIVFGSNFEEVFLDMRKATDANKATAKAFISSSSPTRGGSDLFYILQSVKSLCCSPDKLRNIFLFSDGQLSEEEGIKSVAHDIFTESKSQTRIFSFGIGKGVNSHILQKLSLSTGGAYEYFDPGVKRTWKAQLKTQLMKASQSVLTNVWIDWSDLSGDQAERNDEMKHVHVPEKIKCLFNGSHIIAYSFQPRCTQATLHASICGKEFSTVVTAPSSTVTTGKTLHRLAAKAVLKEYEAGVLGENTYADHLEKEFRKESIIALSIKHSIISRYTSFVAIEKREEGEQAILAVKTGPTISELVNASFVDILSEIQWTSMDDSQEHSIDSLLKRAYQMQSSSIMEARRSVEEAKKAYCLLPSADHERKLLISAAACRLGVTESAFVAWRDLKSLLLDDKMKINQDFLNILCKETSKTELTDGLLDLASKIWPDEFTVQISSYKSNLRPLIITAFCLSYVSDPHFLTNERAHRKFWGWVNTLDGTSNRQEAYVKNVLSIRQFQVSNQCANVGSVFKGKIRHSGALSTTVLTAVRPSPRSLLAARSGLIYGGASVSTLSKSIPMDETENACALEIQSPKPSPYSQQTAADRADLASFPARSGLIYGGASVSTLSKSIPMDETENACALEIQSSKASPYSQHRLEGVKDLYECYDECDYLHARHPTFAKRDQKVANAVPPLQVPPPLPPPPQRSSFGYSSKMAATAQFAFGLPPAGPPPPSRAGGPPPPPPPSRAGGSFSSSKFRVRCGGGPPASPSTSSTAMNAFRSLPPAGPPPPRAGVPPPGSFSSLKFMDRCGGGPPAPPPTSCMALAASKPRKKNRMSWMMSSFFDCALGGWSPTVFAGESSQKAGEEIEYECLSDNGSGIASSASSDTFSDGDSSQQNSSDQSLDSTESCDLLDSSGSFSSDDFSVYADLENITVQLEGSLDISFEKVTVKSLKTLIALGEGFLKQWMKQNPEEELENLFECCMEAEGYWHFPDVKELSNSEKRLFESGKDVIIEAGALSFGRKALDDIVDIFLSAVVILILKCMQSISPSDVLQSMITKASKWLRKRDNVYPSLYRRLELGTKWDDAALKVTRKTLDKLDLACA